jgi:hypothetical protein
VAAGAFEGCRKVGKRRPVPNLHGQPAPGLYQYAKFEEGCGASIAVENTTDIMAAIQFDASDCVGCNFTRGTSGAVIAVPPRSRQILMGISVNGGAVRTSLGWAAISIGAEAAGFAVVGDMLHVPLPPLSPECRNPANRMLPDEAILKRAPPEVIEEPTPKRQNTQQSVDEEDQDAMLAEALKLSLGQQSQSASGKLPGMVDVDEDEDDLAAAIRLSMQADAATPQAQATSQLAARPSTADQKALLTAKVKVLFEEYRQSGMAPHEAATRALAEAQRLLGGG